MDGIKLYHTQPKEVDIEPVCQALLLISQGQEEAGKTQLTAALAQHSVIEVIDALHKWIYEHHQELDPGKLSGFAIRCHYDFVGSGVDQAGAGDYGTLKYR